MKNKADPTPQSPLAVEKNPAYEAVSNYEPDQYWPNGASFIVKHKETGTFWRAVYAIRMDDSDADCSATWSQVEPKQLVVTKYVDVKAKK